jgi:hypothetical protein
MCDILSAFRHTIFPGLLLGALVLHVGLAGDGTRNTRALGLATQSRRLRGAGNCDGAGHDGGDGAGAREIAVGRQWDGLSAWGTTTDSGEACRGRREGRRKDARDARGASGNAQRTDDSREGGCLTGRVSTREDGRRDVC